MLIQSMRAALPLLFAAALPAFAGTPDAIARVERGLRAPVVLAGEPAAARSLRDEMRRLLPPGAAGATMRQLLSHTAGTGVSGFPGYAADKAVPTLVQVLDGTPPANTKPVRIESAPGAEWRYSGGGYSVVQQALIDRTQQPFDVLLRATVLAPIGMRDSRFAQPLPAGLLARAALPHDGEGKPVAGGPYTYPELAAAGLWTTPSDLARFALDLQRSAGGGKGVLSARMARTMLTPVKNGYGLGVNVQGKEASLSFAHGGSNTGYQNTLFAYAHGDGAVVMTNGDNGGELASAVLRALAHEYKWPSQRATVRKAIALPVTAQEAVAGRYDVKGWATSESRAATGA